MVSIIIPTLNEGENLKKLIPKITRILKKVKHEIIIVDDNSQDGTDKIMKGLVKEYPAKYICRKTERGLSSAVLKGFSSAKGEILGVMDGDLSHPPEVIPELLKKINEGYDVAVASRYAKGGGVEDFPFYRQIVSRGATFLALPLVRIKDPMSGYFFFKRDVTKGVELNPIGYKILLELLVKGNYKKFIEVPYIFLCRYVGESKLNSKIYWHYIVHLARLYWYVLTGKR